MPNWCSQDLLVNIPWDRETNPTPAEKEALKRFERDAKAIELDKQGRRSLLDANNFIPYPEKFKRLDKLAKQEQEKIDALRILDDVDKMTPEQRDVWFAAHPFPKDGFNQGGYEWCSKNWGTKWNFCSVELVDETEVQLMYSFETAWAPIIPVITAMAARYPELEFELKYFESGMGYNGVVKWSNGKLDEAKEGDYFGDRGG